MTEHLTKPCLGKGCKAEVPVGGKSPYCYPCAKELARRENA